MRHRHPRWFPSATLHRTTGAVLAGAALILVTSSAARAQSSSPDLRSIAEASDYQRTATHAETVALLDNLAGAHPDLFRRASMGTTEEGRDIPLLIVANPPVASAAEARASGKVLILAFANIHAGEVEGKEALPMLARQIAEKPERPAHAAILRECVLLLAPIYNADGNERLGPSEKNRPGQNGPAIVGQRANAKGLDLNRDFTKAEAAETRAMLRLLHEWDPHLVIDCHTTNGSMHRYTLTYDSPLSAASHPAPVALMREMLPEAARGAEAHGAGAMFWYGDFNEDFTEWRTYSGQARFGANYLGLRGRLSALSESYSYATFEERTRATIEFVRQVCSVAAEQAQQVKDAVALADFETRYAGRNAGAPGSDVARLASVPLRHAPIALPGVMTVRGWETPEGAPARPDEKLGAAAFVGLRPRDFEVTHMGAFEATLSVARPAAYLIPPGLDRVIDLLRAHGVALRPVDAPREREVEEHTIDSITRAAREFQGHHLLTIEASAKPVRREIGPGWTEVRTDQPLGTLIVVLLEPGSEDGVGAWGLLGDALKVGEAWPILRAPRADWPRASE